MPQFKYQGLSPNGVKVSGLIEAGSESSALEKIRDTCSVVTTLEPVNRLGGDINLFGPPKIKTKSLALLCNQFSIILGSGLPIMRTVELVADQTEDKNIRSILKLVAEDVGAGKSFADSFADRGGQLPKTFIETLRAGEETGNLEFAFKRLSTYYDKMGKTRAKAVSAMIYPSIVIIVAIIVVIVIMVVAVPKFTSSFASMGTSLPVPTKILIGMSDFFVDYGIILLVVIAFVTLLLKIYGKTVNGKMNFAKLALKAPVLGKINRMSASSQYANTMATMLVSGIPMVTSLHITSGAINNYLMSTIVEECAGGVETGKRLGDCLLQHEQFPKMMSEMTLVGEETGELEQSLSAIAEYYDNEVDLATSRAISMLEPFTIIFLAGIVALILLAVYLPMFGMYDSMM